MAVGGRLKALYDFENRRTRYQKPAFFPDVDTRFKFCVFVASPSPTAEAALCAFFLQDVSELKNSEQCFPLSADDFARVNPNTGTAPIFRSRRDMEITTSVYGRLPVLVDRSSGHQLKTWPIAYAQMVNLTSDSHLFRTREQLGEEEGAYPIGGNRFESAIGEWVPLYEGKMVQAFDHRAASVVLNPENRHRPAQPVAATLAEHQDVDWLPSPQSWILTANLPYRGSRFHLAFKDVTSPTNVRSMIAAIIPGYGAGNSLPIILGDNEDSFLLAEQACLLAGSFNSVVFDFIARQKIQGQHLNWFIVEQLPVVRPERFEAASFGPKTAGEIVREAVLELTYTAHDMAPFARDMGYVDEAGDVKPPFRWDEERRLHLRAKLDAVFFHLYGVTDRDDVRYIFSTFPIVERQETEAYGSYRSRELCLGYMNALAAGDPAAEIRL